MAEINSRKISTSPKIFGILNVTPDSFSDGGVFYSEGTALEQFNQLLAAGADVVDIGAESTRPGAERVEEAEEWQRLEALLTTLNRQNQTKYVSVDTRKFSIMKKAAALGCGWINCVGPLPSEQDLKDLKSVHQELKFIATHLHGDPKNMQLSPLNSPKVVTRVHEFFESTSQELSACGFREDEIYLDPGIGFGKSDPANVALLTQCPHWSRDFNIAVGVSRKGIFSRLFGVQDVHARDQVSKVAEFALSLCGVEIIRTHDVKGLRHCLNLGRFGPLP